MPPTASPGSDGSASTGGLGAAAGSARRAGLGRAVNALVDATDAVLLRADLPILKATVGELELRGYLRHRGFLEYVGAGMREESYYRGLVLAAVDSQTTFVDAGAHIGVYTLLTCRHARRVVAFEPDPYNFAALRQNVDRAGCANVEIRPEAVAQRAGAAAFRAFRSTFSGSLAPREVDTYRVVDVETINLDATLDDSDLSSLVVKLDVEGAEPLALAGMASSIRRARRLSIFAEVNPEALEAGGSSSERLVEDLLTRNLECLWVDEEQRSLSPLQEPSLPRKGNVVCHKHREG
jgi:FkbM family methyltransferase